MVARDPSWGKAAMDEIGNETGNDRIELLIVDLFSPTSVRDAVQAFSGRHEAKNGLINNVAVFERERKVT
jgi:hypothetical protein